MAHLQGPCLYAMEEVRLAFPVQPKNKLECVVCLGAKVLIAEEADVLVDQSNGHELRDILRRRAACNELLPGLPRLHRGRFVVAHVLAPVHRKSSRMRDATDWT